MENTVTLEQIEKEAIIDRLAACEGNRTKTAESLGVSIRTLQRRLKAWGIPWLFLEVQHTSNVDSTRCETVNKGRACNREAEYFVYGRLVVKHKTCKRHACSWLAISTRDNPVTVQLLELDANG